METYVADAYSPREIAERIETVGVTKARLPLLTKVTLGTLAGGFIGLGALYFTIVVSDDHLSFAVARTLGGLVFSLGLILVIVAGAELFTGNTLLVMSWAAGRVTTAQLSADLLVIYIANFTGAAGLALLVVLSGHWRLAGEAVGQEAVAIAAGKTALGFSEAFFRGIFCNVLVCLAVWLTFAGRTVVDKIAAIVFPISAFVAAGFEHSVANMYFIPLGLLLKSRIDSTEITGINTLTVAGMGQNLLPVTLGNIVGGSVMVALVYYAVYRRGSPKLDA